MGAEIAIIMKSPFDLDKPEEVVDYFTNKFDVAFADHWLTLVSQIYQAEKNPPGPFLSTFFERHAGWQEYFDEFGFLRFGENHLGFIVARGCIIVNPLFRFSHFTADDELYTEVSHLARAIAHQLQLTEAIIIPSEPISFAASLLGSNDQRLEHDPNLPSLSKFYNQYIFNPGDYKTIKDYFRRIYGEPVTDREMLEDRGGQGYVFVETT